MTDIQRTVVEWGARFLEDKTDLGAFGMRLVVPGQGSWRFSTVPQRKVIEEPLSSSADSRVDCTVTVGADDLIAWGRGKLNPQGAFVEGRIRVSGDGVLALRMNRFFGARGEDDGV